MHEGKHRHEIHFQLEMRKLPKGREQSQLNSGGGKSPTRDYITGGQENEKNILAQSE